MSVPMMYRWDGMSMQPLPYFKKQAELVFKSGETYRLVELRERSMNSHRHFFACINEAWLNLNEAMAEHFPTPDHLRKYALTFTQFCTARHYNAESKSEAHRIADYLQKSETYCRVSISKDGKQVTHFVPHSQAVAAMPENRIFMQSKRAVLAVLAEKLGVPLEELERAGARAA